MHPSPSPASPPEFPADWTDDMRNIALGRESLPVVNLHPGRMLTIQGVSKSARQRVNQWLKANPQICSEIHGTHADPDVITAAPFGSRGSIFMG